MNDFEDTVKVISSSLSYLSDTDKYKAYKLVTKGRAHKIDNRTIVLFFDNNYKKSIKKQLKLINNSCYICGCTKDDLTLDHVIPLSMNSTNEEYNLKLCCTECNRRKGNFLLKDFIFYMITNREDFDYISDERMIHLVQTYLNT